MRDILVFMLIFGSLPFIFRSPFVGIIVWTWLSLMNPHRLAWGFVTSLPVAMIVVVTLILSYASSKEPKKVPWTREVIVLAIFIAWMFFTTTQAMAPVAAWVQWDKVWRIQTVILLTLMLTTSRFRIHMLVWTICVSLGFYGFKGGIWTLMTGGAHQVFGPPNTFIGGNNELGLALIMIVPLIWYLIQNTKSKFLKMGLYSAVVLTLIAIIGTHSRGALLGVAGMGVMFFLKSKNRFLPLLLAGIFISTVPYIVPEEWFDRMDTIETYEEDNSAKERIRAWGNAVDLVKNRWQGGGYDALIYFGGRDAHSIYFEVLAEHGFFGLGLFLLLGALTWMKASAVRKATRKIKDLSWAYDLMSMTQVTLVGYAVAGAFLGLAYFDLIYVIMAIVVVTHKVAMEQLQENQASFAIARAPVGSLPAGI